MRKKKVTYSGALRWNGKHCSIETIVALSKYLHELRSLSAVCRMLIS